MKPVLRSNLLVRKSMQFHLIGASAGAATAVSLFQSFLINRAIASLSATVPAELIPYISKMPGIVTTNVLLSCVILTGVMAFVGLIVTHRIAGPAVRMERYWRTFADGNSEGSLCRIRDNDDLQGLCEAINLALEAARSEGRSEVSGAGEASVASAAEHANPEGQAA